MNMRSRVGAVAALCAAMFAACGNAQIFVDNSPDTTGLAPSGSWQNNYPTQIIGDRFTITSNTLVTGGAIFSQSGFGTVGMPVRFMIFADGNFGTPLHNIAASLTAVDTQYTTTQSTLSRKVLLLGGGDQFVLTPGTYWFSMPGDGVEIAQSSTAGGYDDGAFRFGPGTLANGPVALGDMYFQLFTVPAPGALALLGLAGVATNRRRRS